MTYMCRSKGTMTLECRSNINLGLLVHTKVNLKVKLERESPNSSVKLFEFYRQKIDLIFCKHNCIGLPHGPES